MKFLLTTYLFLFSIFAFSQKTYLIENFSDLYFGKVVIAEDQINEVFKKGTISIFDKKTNEEIIQIESNELTFETNKNGNITTNIVELPYGEQSLLIYKDFNFDGIEDLAIMNGQFSCYHGPSYEIYLTENNVLDYNEEFTLLAQEFCGMFQVNSEKKEIYTSTKSGCCWHQYSTYKVIDNSPVAVEVNEEDMTQFPYSISIKSKLVNNKWVVSNEKYIDLEDKNIKILFMFKLKNSEKEVVLFSFNENLNYVFLNKDDLVELSFPNEKSTNIDFTHKLNELSFTNLKTIYTILSTKNTIEIIVNDKGKTTIIEGDFSSIQGDINSVKKLKNVF